VVFNNDETTVCSENSNFLSMAKTTLAY